MLDAVDRPKIASADSSCSRYETLTMTISSFSKPIAYAAANDGGCLRHTLMSRSQIPQGRSRDRGMEPWSDPWGGEQGGF